MYCFIWELFKNLVNGVGCLGTVHVLQLVHTKQILVHFYVTAGQFARAALEHDMTLKIEVIFSMCDDAQIQTS